MRDVLGEVASAGWTLDHRTDHGRLSQGLVGWANLTINAIPGFHGPPAVRAVIGPSQAAGSDACTISRRPTSVGGGCEAEGWTSWVSPQRYGGCVFPQFTPTWQVSVSDGRVADVAWHIYWAQKNLKHPWGAPNKGYPLHRTQATDLIKANRRVSCDTVPRPPGRPDLSCDEYPYAASYEGASKNLDYSCHFLNKDRNSQEGSLKKSWQNSQRVLEEDAFWVEVVKPAAAQEPPQLHEPVGCGHN